MNVKYLFGKWPYALFTLLLRGVVFSWKPVGRLVTINLSFTMLSLMYSILGLPATDNMNDVGVVHSLLARPFLIENFE